MPKIINTHEILNNIDLAIGIFFSNDFCLVKRDLNERSIQFKLATYLQVLFKENDVDCEYNGDTSKENDIKALNIAKDEINKINKPNSKEDSYRISPDIIIHKRGSNDFNLVVIEIKKSTSNELYKGFDLIKLKHLTIDYLGNKYNYKIGMALVFGTDENAGKKSETFFQLGESITDRTQLR